MKGYAFFIMAAAAALAATGCTTPTNGPGATGADTEHNSPAKAGEGITGRHWKLVELNGQPVPALPREPYLILNTEGARVNGFGGCNSFSGSYELDEATLRIRFGQLASTMMACPAGMDVESAFHKVLGSVDNYSLSGDHLTLNRARMAPLARFEAVDPR
jgi:heat shock protein HslJ